MSQSASIDPLSLPLYVAYQPVVCLKDSRPHVAAYECLLRVGENPTGETTYSVIRSAEEGGVMPRLDAFIARQVCADALAKPNMRLWLNVSQATLSSSLASLDIANLITSNRLSDRITLEMTETLDGCERLIVENLGHLKQRSVAVVIDDIEDGFAKSNLLKTDLVTGCKLSRRSTVQLATSNEHYESTARMVSWCQANGKTVVMEGIETEAELAIAIRLGVEYCQGFYFWPALKLLETPLQGTTVVIPRG